MRVYDLPLSMSDRSRRVGVIGSCRVHEPFLRMEQMGVRRVWLDYAVTHTTADALQNLHILAGAEPPKLALPLIYEPPQALRPDGAYAGLMETVDTFLVEVCDRNLIRYGDWSFQINFLFRNFVQPHAAALFGWYKDLTTKGEATEVSIEKALAGVPVSGPSERKQLEDLLRHTRMFRQTPDEMASEMKRLVDTAPGRWIFVSHFAAPDDDGALMTERRELIAAARRGAEAAGAELFDPSVLVARHGRVNALAANGADPYEYAEPFNAVVAEAFCDVLAGGKAWRQKPQTSLSENALRDADAALTALHAERLRDLGAEESGLYSHYEDLVQKGSIFHPLDADWFRYLLDNVAPYERYVLLRAGLGELGLALGIAGRNVVLWDPNPHRRAAMQAGVDRLAEQFPKLRKLVTVAGPDPSEIRKAPKGQTLVIGVALSVLDAENGELEASSLLRDADTLLYAPGRVLRLAGKEAADREAMSMLRAVGFRRFEPATASGSVFARRAS